MPVKAHSREDDLDLTPDALAASKTKSPKKKSSRSRSKSTKSSKGAGSKKKKTGTIATDTSTESPVQIPRLEPSSADVDVAEPESKTGPFNEYIIGGPGSSMDPGVTKHATFPSAPLVSSAPTPSISAGQGQYFLDFVSTPDHSLVKTKLPVEFEKASTVRIGRDSGNTIVIPDQVVSRAHAELSMQNGRVYLKDLNSTNGTFVYDGTDFQQVMDTVEVTPNSVIRFGTTTIVKLTRE